jgi:hypothetical protein
MLYSYAKSWEHLSAVATLSIVIFISARISSSIRFTVASIAVFIRATCSGIICDFRTSLRDILDPVVNSFARQTLPAVNRKYVFMNIFALSTFAHKRHIRERCSCGTPQARSPLSLQKPSLNMRMRVCYLDRHEAGRCSHLVIHIENLLHPYSCFISIYLYLSSIYYHNKHNYNILWLFPLG